MPKKHIFVYLSILTAALVVWIPLYPALYALSYEESPLAYRFLELKPRYVYFGDSVLATSTVCETDHRTVMDFLPDAIATRTMPFNFGGDGADLWRSVARFIASRGKGYVSAAIIPINMEVFSVDWEHNPHIDYSQAQMFYALESERFSLSEYLDYFEQVHSFQKEYRANKALNAYGNYPVMVGSRFIGKLASVEGQYVGILPYFPCRGDTSQYARPLGMRFVVNFGAPVRANDPYFSAIDETVTRLRQAGIHPVVYITPLNLEDVKRFGGADVLTQLEANLDLVRRVARERGWRVIDLSDKLPSADFITRECACEHVDATGRALIARSVAAELKRNHL